MNTRICACPSAVGFSQALHVAILLAASGAALAQQSTPSPMPAPGAAAVAAPGGLHITAKNGQTAAQQSADRGACQNWALDQTHYDPTLQGGGVAPAEEASRRSDYRRAMSACLEARGYSVSYSSPPPAVIAAPMYPPTQVIVTGPQLKYHPFEAHIDGGYTLTTGTTDQYLHGGSNVGVGFTWFPTSALPLGLRIDGSYSTFDVTQNLLALSGNYTEGHAHLYGGTADLQLDLAHRSSRSKFYLFGGAGRYRQQTELRQITGEFGLICGWYYCAPGYFPVVTAQQNTTSPWRNSWNAGIGWEAAIADRTSFFLEARYERILPNNNGMQFVPIRLGLRF